MRRAATLVEALCAIGILAVLAAIIFAVNGPARAQGRETQCLGNIRQLYQGAVLYANDYDGGSLPEIGQLAYIPLKSTRNFVDDYVKNRAVAQCPDWPPHAKRYVSSYQMTLSADPGKPDIGDHPWLHFSGDRKRVDALRETYGADMPVILCAIHDELFYQPNEVTKDDAQRGDPYLIWARDDGSIRRGRLKGWSRSHRIF